MSLISFWVIAFFTAEGIVMQCTSGCRQFQCTLPMNGAVNRIRRHSAVPHGGDEALQISQPLAHSCGMQGA